MKVRLFAPFFLTIILTVPAFAQTQTKAPDSEKIENIRRLIKVTRGEDMRDAMVNQFLDALKPMFANAGPADVRSRQLFNRFSDLLFEEFRKIDFTSITVSLYDKYFTNEEVLGLIRFYETPVGQKAVQVLPMLIQESMARGQAQGELAASRAMSRLAEEFPELKSVVPPLPTGN